jgi:acyl carrier protein
MGQRAETRRELDRENAAVTMSVQETTSGGVTDVVRRMLIERSIQGPVAPDADLREIGLTSLDMVDLVLSVECAFDLQIPEAEITPANFRSIATIDALVNALRS